MTFLFDSGAILLREIRSLSPLEVKGFIHKHTEITAKLVKIKSMLHTSKQLVYP